MFMDASICSKKYMGIIIAIFWMVITSMEGGIGVFLRKDTGGI